MSRVLLVQARPYLDEAHTTVMPPIGLLYLASSLQCAGHQVQVLDAQLRSFSHQQFTQTLTTFSPDLVGISALTSSSSFMHLLAEQAKETLPKVPVVVGSHHPSCYPEETLRDRNIDFVAIGEGERTIVELVEHLEGDRRRNEVRGIAFCSNGSVTLTPPQEIPADLDVIPMPSWELLDLDAYREHPPMGVLKLGRSPQRLMSIVTSRGCPFQCFYCHELHGKRFRERSVENVLSEIRTLYYDYGIRELHIVDDIFNFNLERAKSILRGIIQEGMKLKIHFPNAMRGDRVDLEFMQLLKEAGNFYLAIAIDTGSQRLQQLSRRFLKFDKVKEAVHCATELGMFTVGNFILGFPTETREEMEETIAFARESDFQAAFFYLLTPFPGSRLEQSLRHKIPRTLHDFDHYITDRVVYQESMLSTPELFQMRKRAYLQFYLSRRRLLRGPLPYALYRNLYFLLELLNFLPGKHASLTG